MEEDQKIEEVVENTEEVADKAVEEVMDGKHDEAIHKIVEAVYDPVGAFISTALDSDWI